MKTNKLLLIIAMATAALALKAGATSVSFTEGAEGENVTVDFDATWFVAFPSPGGPELASFFGVQAGDFGSGSYSVGLLEPANGTVSDYVGVSWSPYVLTGFTIFNLQFGSDIGEVPPFDPALLNASLVEDGTLQTFEIPGTGGLTVGIKSDLESVPEGGSTLILLALGVASTAALRRRSAGLSA